MITCVKTKKLSLLMNIKRKIAFYLVKVNTFCKLTDYISVYWQNKFTQLIICVKAKKLSLLMNIKRKIDFCFVKINTFYKLTDYISVYWQNKST